MKNSTGQANLRTELDAEADAGDRYLVYAPIENELSGPYFVCKICNRNRREACRQPWGIRENLALSET